MSSEQVEAPDAAWGHDMYEGHAAANTGRSSRGSSGIETGTKLLINNLDYGVSNEDIKELFAEVGDIKRATIHYDRSGRSKGTAEVVFSRRRDAELAIKKYDNVQLDGKPMKIELIGTNMGNDAGARPAANYGNQNGASRRGGIMGRLNGGNRAMRPQGDRVSGGGGGGGRGRGRGRGRGGERGEKVSAEDLDADLEKTMSRWIVFSNFSNWDGVHVVDNMGNASKWKESLVQRTILRQATNLEQLVMLTKTTMMRGKATEANTENEDNDGLVFGELEDSETGEKHRGVILSFLVIVSANGSELSDVDDVKNHIGKGNGQVNEGDFLDKLASLLHVLVCCSFTKISSWKKQLKDLETGKKHEGDKTCDYNNAGELATDKDEDAEDDNSHDKLFSHSSSSEEHYDYVQQDSDADESDDDEFFQAHRGKATEADMENEDNDGLVFGELQDSKTGEKHGGDKTRDYNNDCDSVLSNGGCSLRAKSDALDP
ncbi:THO complex subunit 4A-like protein [Tanacetum coccineum]|uniref:THO complex subunit 4A-like protein n=1 Tax=Tanacetum coccineum TaxID=301880 RepID=A0ABQ5ED59_9ASTR